MDITVVISTWNNFRRLRVTLESLASSDVAKSGAWELVLVNNNCADDTDAVAGDFRDRLPLVYVHEPVQGLSRARNRALQTAKGELVIFADDDVKFVQDWTSIYWRAYRQMAGHYFGGPVESEFELAEPDSELLRFAPFSVKGLDWGPAARALAADEQFLAANWACPRHALLEVGAFDETRGLGARGAKVSVGEERELQSRLRGRGWQPWYLPEPRVWHYVPAAKCTLEHIVARAEAAEYEAALRATDDGAPRIGRVPRWLVRRFAEAWLQWVAGRMLGRRPTGAYVTLQKCRARIRAYREAAR
jgi:glucosyl-dolichyl phosphate glucuronosyltransferase